MCILADFRLKWNCWGDVRWMKSIFAKKWVQKSAILENCKAIRWSLLPLFCTEVNPSFLNMSGVRFLSICWHFSRSVMRWVFLSARSLTTTGTHQTYWSQVVLPTKFPWKICGRSTYIRTFPTQKRRSLERINYATTRVRPMRPSTHIPQRN